MTNCKQLVQQEKLITYAIQPLIRELLLVDVSDFIVYLNLNQHHQVADIIDSASEQYFAPGFVGYREEGSAKIEWDKTPEISLELVLNTPTQTFDFTLTLEKTLASVSLQNIGPPANSSNEINSTSALTRAVEINSLYAEQ